MRVRTLRAPLTLARPVGSFQLIKVLISDRRRSLIRADLKSEWPLPKIDDPPPHSRKWPHRRRSRGLPMSARFTVLVRRDPRPAGFLHLPLHLPPNDNISPAGNNCAQNERHPGLNPSHASDTNVLCREPLCFFPPPHPRIPLRLRCAERIISARRPIGLPLGQAT